MKKKILVWTLFLLTSFTKIYGQNNEQDPNYKKFFVGSTFFMLGNLNKKDNNNPEYYQLNFGYRITPKNVVSLELKTWKYAWPVGIPYGKSFEAPAEKYPGYIRSNGFAFVYQRFLWNGLYTAVHAMNSIQKYYTEDNKKIQNGYQLFMQYRVGYHIPLFKNRFFIEPSLAVTHRPIDSNMPESFAKLDNKWPKYFFPEPGLHFGVKF